MFLIITRINYEIAVFGLKLFKDGMRRFHIIDLRDSSIRVYI